MSTKRRARKANSLHVQVIFAMVLACILPLAVVAVLFVNSYREQTRQEMRGKVQELCADFANRIQNTGYLTNSAQAELSAAMDTAAQFYDGRILVVNSELQIIKDTFKREEGRTMISEEVVRSLREKPLSYEFLYEDTTEIIYQVRDSLGKTVLGSVVFIYDNPEYVGLSDDISKTSLLVTSFLVGGVLCAILIASAKMVFPLKKLAFNLQQLADGDLQEKVDVKGNYEVETIVDSVNNMLEDMRNTEQRRQEFVSNVSHELKTPLTSMKVLAESLVGQNGIPEELYQEFLHDINTEIDRENEIITDLLNIVRLDRKEGEMHIAQVSINELLEIVMRRLRPIAKERNVEMVFESFRSVLAEVDEVKMSLVFTNLIENAIKYNKEGGQVKVSLNADHRYFYVRVEDTGIGIPEEAKKYIFDRFYRVDKARSRETGGTGLGLAITKSAVMMHKGNIKVSGKEGEGSVFVVRIPLSFVPEYKD
ncbi:MAG: two-component sensor histidine kinase [Lachnospiraceae bacterium]|nr:two-component sensor histidine kinase [Lachnospiraceae bacterium]MBQ8633626.1 two-component sensor histidine kinase [Lachnospiraceae bacterium]